MKRSRKKVAAKAPAAPAQALPRAPPPPAPPPPPPLPKEVLAPIRDEAEKWVRSLMVEKRKSQFPELATKWLNRLMDSPTLERAHYCADKAMTFGHLQML